MKYRRAETPVAPFSIAVDTLDRRWIFKDEQTVLLLRQAIKVVQAQRPLTIKDDLILMDLLHNLWRRRLDGVICWVSGQGNAHLQLLPCPETQATGC